jgi:glycosyltransferase involved in cell wall biosynthesis
MPELSIIVPCRDDAGVLPGTLDSLHQVVTQGSLSVETLIVDDESSDDTIEVAKRAALTYPALHVRVLSRKRLLPGMGGVLRYGMAFATGPYAALVSSDGQDPVELIPVFLRHLRAGRHLVQCSRYLRPEDAGAVTPKFRVYQYIYRAATKLLVGTAAADTTYGFRAFDRVFILALGLSSKRFNVCPEMTFKVLLCGGSIEYVPGKPRGFLAGGQSKFQLPSEILGYAYVLLRAGLHRAGIRRWF